MSKKLVDLVHHHPGASLIALIALVGIAFALHYKEKPKN